MTGRRQGRSCSSNSDSNKMSFIIVSLFALLISISAFSARGVESKPLNQNQVKFRRLPPKEFSAALGSSITIECEAGGSPPPTIHWLKNGKRIVQNDFDENQLEELDGQQALRIDDVNRIALSSTRSRLFIDCADFQDEAVYTCVAENAFSRISSHTKLNLIKPLSATGSGSGEDDLLSGPLDEVAAMELAAATGGIKQLAAAAGGSSGGGGYSSSEIPLDKSLSAVPQCLSQRSARTSEPVRIHMWTHNIVEIMKNNIVLYCRSNVKKIQQQQQQQQQSAVNANSLQQTQQQLQTSSDLNNVNEKNNQKSVVGGLDGGNFLRKALVSWTLPNDKFVDADQKDKYEILETGDLLIKDLRWSDMGSYVCTVSDEQNSDSVSTFVYPAAVKMNSKRAPLNTRLADFR